MSFETIILEDSILNFADNSALENALSDIENVSGLLKKEGFKSLYNVFDDAMGDADNYYDTKEHYEEFKVNAARKSKVDDNTAKMQSIKWLGV